MRLLKFLKREGTASYTRIIAMAVLSGMANALILAIINSAAKMASNDGVDFQYLLMFVCVISLYIISIQYILKQGIIIIEGIIDRIRVRLSGKIRLTDLLSLEKIGDSEIYNRLTNETTVISQSAGIIIASMQSMVMLLFATFYIASLSIVAFIITIILLVAGISVYLGNQKVINRELHEANKTEIDFFDSLTGILKGFKEIKLNSERGDDILSFNHKVSESLKNLKISSGIKYANNYIFSNAFYYFLIAIIVFILPRLSPIYSDVITQLTAAILFIIGPVSNVVALIPVYDKVNLAIEHIYGLEMELDNSVDIGDRKSIEEKISLVNFNEIILKNIKFSYFDKEGKESFSVGPVNFNFKKGEVLFFIGGNGCGKTTLLKLLTYLYHPAYGDIFVDNIKVDSKNVVQYRELYSAIFSDFHLFDRLYGLSRVDPDKIRDLLKLFNLDVKTQFQDGRFTNLDLSTGQKKRLALLVSFLEDKPIYIFDEWAADQDPQFRKYFYEVILKELKEKRKTVIGVTHDDRYFKSADRILKMDYGTLSEYKINPSELRS